jgi:lipoic acid synthetase
MATNPTRDRVNPERVDTTPLRRPSWIRVRAPSGETYEKLYELMRKKSLHTVCEEAGCPNMGECWGSGTATFLMMGDVCTRTCGFCDIKHGKPEALDWIEPMRVAQAVKSMNLRHAVITSVDRDDLKDGGAAHWAETIREIKLQNPEITIEVLVPDFDGKKELIERIAEAGPEIISHNLETVERLTPLVRSRAKYPTSLKVIENIVGTGKVSKSGIMLGLGETRDEILRTMDDLVSRGCEIFTMGQYLQPTKKHLEVAEYIHPDEFLRLKEEGLKRGFRIVESAPLVRSSYHAEKHIR